MSETYSFLANKYSSFMENRTRIAEQEYEKIRQAVLQEPLANALHEKSPDKRDYLSITPKLEDLALVNRWIQKFGVPHYYLQVFFDKAYVISFREILEISSDSSKEDVVFSIEQDIKNQGKTTIKINVQVGREILGRIDMPEHRSALKELERGRLLFYVTFEGGKGYLDPTVLSMEILNNV